jgi:hypothetical protein
MEEHHTHHPKHKKKWAEYIIEFVMLFFAVFLGFIAENIREHIGEQNRAKEFSASLVRDLQSDTIAINNQIKNIGIYIAVSDSLIKLSKTKLEGRNASQFLFYSRFAYWTREVSWNRSTFEQIKSSGSLRYFRNVDLLQKLLEYDALVNNINMEAENNKIRGNMLLTSINSIIDPQLHQDISKYSLPALDTMSTKTKESFFSSKTGTLENKREKIMEMLNMVIVNQRNHQSQVNESFSEASILAAEIINTLKKEYHLE